MCSIWPPRRDNSNVAKTAPVLVSGQEGQLVPAAFGKNRPEIKAFIADYSSRLVE